MLYLRRAKFRTRAIPQSVFDERFSTSSRQISHKPRANRYNASTRQRINAASNRSCRFIFRNASPLSSVRIESKPLGSSAVRIRMQIRRVCRRSLLRFNGRIKLIQIYIPEQDTHGRTHGKSERARRGRFSTDCYPWLLLHRVQRARFTRRGCGFIIPFSWREISEQKGPRYLSPAAGAKEGPESSESCERPRSSGTRGYGPVTTHLPRHNGAAYALRAGCSPALCVARPDSRLVPRRTLASQPPNSNRKGS